MSSRLDHKSSHEKRVVCECCGIPIVPYCADCSVMTMREAGKRLHCSVETIRRRIRSGELVAIGRVYGRVLIRREDVEAMLGR